jgi:hypothetical protein
MEMSMPKMRRRGAPCVLVLFGSLLATAAAADTAAREGVIVGQIVNQVTGRSVPGVVVLVEETAAQAESDGDGRFLIAGQPVGTYRLSVTHARYAPVRKTDVVVNADRETSVVIELLELPALKESVQVSASSFERLPDVANSAHVMSYEEIRRAPGALGDVGRMVQALPGVASHQDDRNDIIARGGSPIENLVTVDGIEVPNVNHFASQGASGGAISMLSAETISGATFIAGGLPSQYGNRLSSALEIALREGSRRRLQVESDLGLGGAGLILEGPLGKRGSWLVSARRSYLDLVAGAFSKSAIPLYSNYLVKAVHDLGGWGRLSLLSLGGTDAFNELGSTISADDPEAHSVDMSSWRSVTGLNLQTFLGARGVLNASASYALGGYRVDDQERALGRITSSNRSSEGEATLRSDLTLQLAPRVALRAGLAAKRFSSHYDLDQPGGWQNDFSADPRRVNAFTTDARDATDQEGGYAQLTLSPHPRLDLNFGGRVDRYGFARQWAATPRASALVRLGRGIALSTTYGRYSQMPPFPLMVGLPENRSLSLMRADHAIVGLDIVPRADLKLTIEAYDKRYRDYPVSIENPFLSLASMAGFYDINEILMPMTSRGSGKARGIEFALQKKLTRAIYGQVSYAYSRTEHRALDGVWRLSGYDLPHVLSLVAGVRLSQRWEVSTKFAYSSGRPVTPLREQESREQNRSIFDAERLFTERGPAYHRLDLRADRRFHRPWGTVTLYLEGDNLYDRKNVLRYVWNANARRLDSEAQLSLLVLGGLTVQF